MGIDPVTHEPLHNESEENSKTDSSEQFPESEKDNQNIPIQNSYSPTDQNSSSDDGDESNLYENDPLISCLFRDDDPPHLEFPWEFPSPQHNLNTFWDDNCQWLLDCQDFGIHDFGFESFNDMEITSSVEMGKKQ